MILFKVFHKLKCFVATVILDNNASRWFVLILNNIFFYIIFKLPLRIIIKLVTISESSIGNDCAEIMR